MKSHYLPVNAILIIMLLMSWKKNREEIIRFRDAYREYLALQSTGHRSSKQEDRMAELRSQINRSVPLVTSYVQNIGEPTTIYYSPPPAVGGLAGQMDVLANIFNRSAMGITQHILDMLDRAIGRYDFVISNRWKTLINPFHWLGELIRIPFHLLRFSGFDAKKIELSIFGKAYKAIVSLVALLGGLVKLYDFSKPFLLAKGITLP